MLRSLATSKPTVDEEDLVNYRDITDRNNKSQSHIEFVNNC